MVAYNVPNWGTIGKNEAKIVTYTWNNGGYGAQWAQASPASTDAPLVVNSHTMVKNDDGTMWYEFFLQDQGPNDTSYDLDGGSVGS
jgi:hypothetical protein